MNKLVLLAPCAIAVLMSSPALFAGKAHTQDQAACAMATAHERTQFVGKVITFTGDFKTDHIERSVIIPLGCRSGFGVGSIGPGVEQILDALDHGPWPPFLKIRASFTGLITQVEPSGAQFYQDDGVRITLTGISSAHALPDSLPKHESSPSH